MAPAARMPRATAAAVVKTIKVTLMMIRTIAVDPRNDPVVNIAVVVVDTRVATTRLKQQAEARPTRLTRSGAIERSKGKRNGLATTKRSAVDDPRIPVVRMILAVAVVTMMNLLLTASK